MLIPGTVLWNDETSRPWVVCYVAKGIPQVWLWLPIPWPWNKIIICMSRHKSHEPLRSRVFQTSSEQDIWNSKTSETWGVLVGLLLTTRGRPSRPRKVGGAWTPSWQAWRRRASERRTDFGQQPRRAWAPVFPRASREQRLSRADSQARLPGKPPVYRTVRWHTGVVSSHQDVAICQAAIKNS